MTIVALLERHTLTATVVSNTAWEQQVISDVSFEDLGPYIQEIVPHAETRQLTGDFEWRVVLQRKYLDADWTPAAANIAPADKVLTEQTEDGYTLGAPYTDRTRLGIRLRLLLQWHTLSTGAVGDMAEVSLIAAVRRWT